MTNIHQNVCLSLCEDAITSNATWNFSKNSTSEDSVLGETDYYRHPEKLKKFGEGTTLEQFINIRDAFVLPKTRWNVLAPWNLVSKVMSQKNGSRVSKRLELKNITFRQKNNAIPLNVLVEEHKDDHYIGYDQFFNKSHHTKATWPAQRVVTIEKYEIKQEANYAAKNSCSP